MAMYAQRVRARVGPIQHDIVRPNELAGATNINTNPQYVALVHRMRVRVANAEGCDAGAGTIGTFLVVKGLLLRGCQ